MFRIFIILIEKFVFFVGSVKEENCLSIDKENDLSKQIRIMHLLLKNNFLQIFNYLKIFSIT